MPTVLLVHGAWHGSWCWVKIVGLLQNAGVNAVTVDLPGRAGDDSPVEALTLESYARRVCRVATLQHEPVIAVGHSMGGMVITQAAEYDSKRFKKLVYLCAFLPANGEALRDILPTDSGSLVYPSLEPDTPKPGYFSFKKGAPLREIFYADSPEDDVRRAAAMLVPESMALIAVPAAISAQKFGSIPRVYIECTEDKAIPLAIQRAMRQKSLCEKVYSLRTDHSPFFSTPAELAKILIEVALQTR